MDEQWKQCQTLFFWAPKSLQMVTAAMKLKDAYSLEGKLWPTYYFASKGLSSQGYGFSCGHVWMWELDCEESWELKNWCFWTVVLEKTLESPLDCKEIQPVHSKGDQFWVFVGRCWNWTSSTLATSCKDLTHWKRPWCWEGLGAGGEGDDRGWDGWMASLTQWTWVCVNSGGWWWTGRTGMLWFMGSQRVGHDWATELNWTEDSYWLELLLVPWIRRTNICWEGLCFLFYLTI